MNGRYLLFTLFMLIVVGLSIRSKSTLTPERGVDHVFYGSYNNFMAQEVTSGDFNGDGLDDVVASLLWDSPGGCDAVPQRFSSTFACENGIGRWAAEKGGEDTVICAFSDPDLAEAQRAYWEDECGWTIVDTLSCGECWQALWFNENQGAVYVEMGGDWSSKGHDFDFPTAGSDHMVVGESQGDGIYNGLAAGNVNGDSYDELILGADQRRNGGPGEVYVISGGNAWPDTIRPPDDDLVMHYLRGRDSNDGFGVGIAAGDLNDDGKADVVVAAPFGDGPSNGRTDCGDIYVFYSVGSLPTTVDLSQISDSQLATSTYAQVIWGAAANDTTGLTKLQERHEEDGNHRGNYEPVGLAIGDWDGDGRNDLAIGAGSAGGPHSAYQGGDGVVYVIFGGGLANKLRPGHTIDLSGTLGSSNAADVRIVGKDGSALGAGIAFVDADGGDGKDDLILGAPLSILGGDSLSWDYKGEAYIIWGDTKGNLTSNPDRSAGDSNDIDVTIIGQDGNDQLGGHISGNQDIDGDGKNDIGIAGQDAAFVFFGQARGEWESEIDLATVIDSDPDTRILALKNVGPEANSTTIRLAHVDADQLHADLIFGGYDLPGIEGQAFPDQRHAGQMWMMSGSEFWKSGAVSSSQTWSGNVFLDGDIVVTNGSTLTIAAGTDVWAWPTDVQKNGLGVDTIRVEIRVEDGSLVVQGAANAPVRFLAWDAVDSETDASDKWFGIWINDDCSGTIDHAVIRNAYRGIQTRSSLTLKNSVIEDCVYVGVTIAGDSTDADSLYMYNTTVRRITNTEPAGIGINVLGKKAAANLESCTVRDCNIGVAAYSKAKLYTMGTVVKNTSLQGVQVSSRGDAVLIGGSFASDGKALAITDGGTVYAGLTEFKNSEYGVWIEKDGASMPSAEFAECQFDSNDVGVQVAETDIVELDGCLIRESDSDGVYCLSGADITIIDCVTGGNGGSAVRCDDSAPELTDNYLGDNNGGVTCHGTAYPKLRGNKVWNNNNGIGFVDDASADMQPCGGSCPPCGNANSFKGNSGYHASNLTGGDIYAACNYWGKSTPNPAKFYGSVYYTPYLSSDPLPTAPRPEPPKPDLKLPTVYRLTGNAPNPFNPVTTIRYQVPPPGGHVRMRVYNVRGQLVRTLLNEHSVPGYHEVRWNGVDERGTEVASGVYFVEMIARQFHSARKIVMLK